MKRRYNYILIFFILSVAELISCKKSFLDVEDNTYLIREQYVKDMNSLQQYMNGIYVLMTRDFFTATQFANNGVDLKAGGGTQIYAELVADNVKPANTSGTLFPHYSWNQLVPTDQNMNNCWYSGYQVIRACSYVIEKADELKGEDPSKANQLSGQAYAIRAIINFQLVNVFAQAYNFTQDGNHPGIPYITSWDWNDAFQRNTVKEVYEGIISDLKKAISLLPAGNYTKTIVNQLAAKALLARVYLFKEDWQNAKEMAMEITNVVPLLPTALYPAKLFTPDETEALFQLVPSHINLIPGGYTTAFPGFSLGGNGYFATRDIADLLTQDPDDSRRSWIKTTVVGRDSIRKFPINVVPGFGTSAADLRRSYFHTLFRSSEMFLTVAEAAAKLNDETIAKQYLDAIRKRANPAAINITATGPALLDSIYLERRKELAFEGLRMFDLLRWKRGVNRIDAIIGAPLSLPYPSDRAISPIPLTDLDYGIPQNPSY